MLKKLVATAVLAALVGAVAMVGFAAAPSTAIQPIAADSPCPAAGCASDACHGFEAVPEPGRGSRDGVPRGRLRVDGVPWVGLADRALPSGLRHVVERVDTYAGGPRAGAVAARAPHGPRRS